MKIVFSWDDGALEDQKLFELHEKYSIPGIFFVPTENREGRKVLTPEIMRKVESKYITFGGHTKHHTYLTELPVSDVEAEVVDNQKYLEDILGHSIDHFCLPGGRNNRQILSIIFEHYKTIRTADTMNFKCDSNLLKPSIHFFDRGIKSMLGNSYINKSIRQMLYVATHLNSPYFEMIKGLIRNVEKEDNAVVAIWGHSWELEEYNLWNELEELFRYLREKYYKQICQYNEVFPSTLTDIRDVVGIMKDDYKEK